ncbi:4'-phosphopantetheinyl transferase superfamily protein [Hydrogenophaga sp.]
MRSIGIDLERDRPMETALWPSICTKAEEAHVRAQPVEWQGHLMIRLFSAKEAVYKWQYPQTHRMLEFSQVEVNWLGDGPEARFVAQVKGAGKLGPVQGQCLVHEDLVVSLVCMR